MNKKKIFKISAVIIGLLLVIGVSGYFYLRSSDLFEFGCKITKIDNQVKIDGRIVDGADAASFQNVSGDYYKDKNNVYYSQSNFGGCAKAEVVQGADVKTIKGSHNHADAATDKNFVYFGGVAMIGSNGPSFVDNDPNYMYDKNQVYFGGGRIISDSDAGSFAVIAGGVYAKDKNHIYYPSYFSTGGFEVKIIEMADVNSFKVTGDGFAEDKNHKYYNGEITSIDQSHKVFGETPYIADNTNVYYKGKIIDGADPKSFEILTSSSSANGYYAKDKNHVYLEGNVVVDADPETFIVLNSFGKDKNFVFYKGKKFENSDGSTFELKGLECCQGQDKNYTYAYGCIYKDNKQIGCLK